MPSVRHILVTPGAGAPGTRLFCLAMQRMLAAARAEFLKLQAAWIIATVLFCGVIPFLTLRARQGNHRTDIFL
jgi:hypothetical protein